MLSLAETDLNTYHVIEFSLSGKTILITGASSGIGRETAIMLTRAGASVIITGRDCGRLGATFESLVLQPDATAAQYVADLTAEAEMDSLISAMPVLNGIVHCAGIVGPLPVKFITQPDIDMMFAINYHVPVNLTSKLLRNRKVANGSSLLFMSSIATRNPYFGGALYSGSKAALEAYSRTLALELVQKHIRSNCIQAGLVDTPMIVGPSEGNMQAEAHERYLKRYPLGIGQPANVAQTILYFMSDASKWVTGTSLIMGGE
ncbi:MAG: 3-oxoacyl-ACP reductase [Bacteroidetes bacterium HGW-Bacteroidetes-22]|nr:MAG: 3-oxoacyl-ACP reductase [Bacteroidetes bacterium HGW-Bacteroidetes-22]